jgi:alkylation response protein AidB-like acyl-CoA dehydrogenase
MADTSYLEWPFFEDRHRQLAREFVAWADSAIGHGSEAELRGADLDRSSIALVRQLGAGGWLRAAVGPVVSGSPSGTASGAASGAVSGTASGTASSLDVRTLCIMRETLAARSGLADFAFALQALGAGPITLFGSDELRARYLPRVAAGKCIGGFALSESGAGSDVGAMTTTARRVGDSYVIDGEKQWISNAGVADFYVAFCRLPEAGERGFVALVVDSDAPGFSIERSTETTAPHVIGTLAFDACVVPAANMVGAAGKGMNVALGTLDVFRPTVGAAALGFARCALDEALKHVTTRVVFGAQLAELQLTKARLARMALDIDASALLVYRAAWARDQGASRITREAAMAKWYATEAAQRAADDAVQLLGARGLVLGSIAERLYREVRALRIYEGTSEIQQLIIADQVLSAFRKET